MYEITVNLHMHTRYSDGHGSHQDIAEAALKTGLDVVIVSDHNVWVNGPEGYHHMDGKRVLMLVGEEVHDVTRQPQKNHMLVFGADREMAAYAKKPQRLINAVKNEGGLSFLAHPYDEANDTFGEIEINWVDWDITGFTGVELWNGLSELKTVLKTWFHGLFFVFMPHLVPHAPPAKMLKKWDDLLSNGRKVVAIGGSDAHQLPTSLGPIKRRVFPYATHFKSVNTHVLLSEPLTGDVENDKAQVYAGMRAGHLFIGNDQPASTKGFRFSGQSNHGDFMMGDEANLGYGVTLQIRLPLRTECILLKNGEPFKTWTNRDAMVVNISEPGVYRVEAYINYYGVRRGWIFSNPIYIRDKT